MFTIQQRYRAVAREHGFAIPAGYDDLMGHVADARGALAVRQTGIVPCNNDLLAANFIDDGERIWLIDYEYSGNNDPCFELGNIWGRVRAVPGRAGRADRRLLRDGAAEQGSPGPGSSA
jgi:Predicted choline kinase involved in LPS biosynthesis